MAKDDLNDTEDDLEIIEVDTPAGEEGSYTPPDDQQAAQLPEEDDDHDDHDEDDDQEDTRLAEKDESAEEGDERQKRKLGQRQRQKLARARDKAELAELRAENAEFKRRLSTVESHTLSVNEGLIGTKLEEVRRDIATADALLADAVKNADGDTYASAMRLRDEAKAQEAELVAAHKAAGDAKKAVGEPVETQTSLAERWRAANASWYGRDIDSTIAANTIDAQLMTEGKFGKGDNPEYFRELTRRITAHFNKQERPVQDDSRQTRNNGADTRRRGPPIGDKGGGGAANGGPRKVMLSKDRVDAIKAAGDWDDPKERAKAIKAYEEYDREHAAQR